MSRLTNEQFASALDHLSRGAWQAAHVIVQQDEQWALACWAHGIVHILEGDLDNARYWDRRARREFPPEVDVKAELEALREAAHGEEQP